MRPDRTCNSSSWTKEEDKASENTLADYYGDSNVFRNIAAAVPQKSNQEILDHFSALLEDISDIESGIVPLPKYRRNRSTVARRKGIPWTAEEHRLFLQGLAKHDKGDWRGISRNFVLSRTPTQVASHAQKFFRRLKDNDNSRRRRSIHDITSAADITEPSHGQESDELKGTCEGKLQRPITDDVTKAFDTGMLSSPGPVTNCTTDAIEGQSAVNPEKFPLGAALGSSELNSSFPGVDEFLQSIKNQITVLAEGTSGVYHGVDTRTSRPLSLQPSVAGGTTIYTHPVSFPNVDEFLHDVEGRITVPAKGTSGALLGVGTRTLASHSLQPSVPCGSGIYTHPVTEPAESTSGASRGVDTRTSPSLSVQSVAGSTGIYTHPASSSGAMNGFMSTVGASEGVFSVNSMLLQSIPASSGGGTYPCWYPSSKDDNIFDWEDLFPDHIVGFGK